MFARDPRARSAVSETGAEIDESQQTAIRVEIYREHAITVR
jgi:hypothetical protein